MRTREREGGPGRLIARAASRLRGLLVRAARSARQSGPLRDDTTGTSGGSGVRAAAEQRAFGAVPHRRLWHQLRPHHRRARLGGRVREARLLVVHRLRGRRDRAGLGLRLEGRPLRTGRRTGTDHEGVAALGTCQVEREQVQRRAVRNKVGRKILHDLFRQ